MQLKRSVLIFLAAFCIGILGTWHYFDEAFKPFLAIKGVCLYPVVRLSGLISDCAHWYGERARMTNDLRAQCKALDQERCFFREKYIQLQSYHWYKESVNHVIEKIDSLYSLDSIRIGLILTRHFSSQEHYIFVDKGSCDGITCDMVACSDSCLIGRVIEVFSTYCKVLLITDTRCSIPVLCGEKRAAGVVQGLNQTVITMKYVDRLEPIFENDLVITSGTGFIFPYGLGVGIVTAVDSDYIHKIITIRPFIDYKEIKYCFLIKKDEIRFN